MKLLVVEDDAILAENLVDAIANQGYIVDCVGDGESAWLQLKIVDYDLILLDLMLPKLDGLSLCKRLRTQQSQTRILMLTALDAPADQVRGLDAGADDYLAKPFDLPILMARIRALLRRGHQTLLPILTWDDLRLNPKTHRVTYADRAIALTPKEFSILEQLLRQDGKVLKQATLINHVWSDEAPPLPETIRVHIKTLRQKLKAAGAPHNIVATIHGVGYYLNRS